MSDGLKVFLLMLTMCGVTYLIRMLPFVFFKRKVGSRFIKSLLYYIPYAVLSAMTFPAVLYTTENFYAGLVGTVVALIAAAFKLSLIIVALLSCLAVFAVLLIF